jgi:broad specificity phosphatase PhoE
VVEALAPAWLAAAGEAATGLAAIVAGWAAVRGLDDWRREAVGRRKAELAEEVLAQFYRAKDILTWARFPDRAHGERTSDASRNAQLRLAASAPIERLVQESQLFSELQASRYRFMAYFGEAAARPFADLGAIHSEIVTSAGELVRTFDDNAEPPDPARRDAWETTVGWGGEDLDTLARRLDEAVAEIERTCRPLIDEGGTHRRKGLLPGWPI